MTKFEDRESSMPVLAYHEIHEESERGKKIRTMGPSCSIHKNFFSQHLFLIKQHSYETIIFSDLTKTSTDLRRKVIITFDDGHIGNYLYAYPLLLKYGLKAVFFVTTNFIETNNMLNWRQLKEMNKYGMSIQSHGVTHTPLETLSRESLRKELAESKRIIEDNVGIEVDTISLPHGSIHSNICDAAFETGYKFVCTSKISYYYPIANEEVSFIPRVPIEDNCSFDEFRRILLHESLLVARKEKVQKIKYLCRKVIGINNYRKVYRIIHRIKLT